MKALTKKNLKTEFNGCMKYFLNCVSKKEETFGLVLDMYPGKPTKSSIAATGFGLAALAVAAEECPPVSSLMAAKARKLLATLHTLPSDHGFFYHFYDIETGGQYEHCEISTIDTAILLCGAITAGEYFGGDIKESADKLYARTDWMHFLDTGHKRFYMAKYGDNFCGHWDAYAEQMMMYVLSAACENPDYRVSKEVYYNMHKFTGSYKKHSFIYTWYGSLFAHQFSHAFIDFYGLTDAEGVDWFENSVTAAKASRQFCMDYEYLHKSYSKDSWGISACDTRDGYSGRQGTPPSGNGNIEHLADGTVAPYAAIASVIFNPAAALSALDHYYTVDKLIGEYGLLDAYNLDLDWHSEQFIGIDKGITLLMLSNYLRGTVHKYFMKNTFVCDGLKELGFTAQAQAKEDKRYGKHIFTEHWQDVSGWS